MRYRKTLMNEKAEKMKNGFIASMFGAVAVMAPMAAWANGAVGEGYHHGGRMMGGHGLYGPLMLIITVAAIAAIVVLAMRWSRPRHNCRHRRKNPKDILRERYARGEMTTKEFEERRKVLGD